MEVILTSGPDSDFSETATRDPDDATTEELELRSTNETELSDVSTSWRSVVVRIARCSCPFESVGIEMSIISSSKLSAKILKWRKLR